MAHTYTNLLTHALFSTKDRQPLLRPEIEWDLYAYRGGIIASLRGKPVLINGPKDHVHLLFVLPASLSLSDLMEKLKANSSKWAALRWLERYPRVHFHYTPTHASWVNMVECFFSILGKQGLSQSVHASKHQLKEFLLDYIARNNENPRPFVWTKGPEKLQRIIEATQEYQAMHPGKPRKHSQDRNSIKN